MTVQAPAVLQPLRVFVASPGGVQDERRAIRQIAEELNVPLRGRGWEIVVLGWEERGPTGGRAQADINADVRLCDVFVGVLWDRWGTPTGESTSGFAEEWAIARDRHRASGRPDLWLFFKKLPEDPAERPHENPQLEAVQNFRREVEDGELAFYKTFDDVNEFEGLVRRRLLDEIFDRSGLTRTDLGSTIDWAAAYEDEPVALLPDGRNRAALADELEASAPAEAAALLVALADDADERGFAATAEQLRVRGCRVWIKAGDTAAAVSLLRRLLAAHLWELRFQEMDMLLRQLDEEMPPDLTVELKGWRACLDAPDKPIETAAALEDALCVRHGFPLDSDTVAHWHAVRWRCLLDTGNPQGVTGEDFEVNARRGESHLELAMLRADALRAAGRDEADAAWQQLRVLAVREATEEPEFAAWIATRAALDAVAWGDLTTAEAAYVDAATRWTKVAGARGNAAHAFFSAQAAAHLRGDWSFTGWSWRPIAAGQRGRTTGLVARAEALEREAMYNQLDNHLDKAMSLLRAAVWCHLRAGFVDGVMRCRALLADAHAAVGDEVSAVGLYCEVGQRSEAEKVARDAVDRRGVAARMAEALPIWAAEARFAVLAQVGNYASPHVVSALTSDAIAATEPKPERQFDNTPVQAAEALASLALAVEDTLVLKAAVAKLQQLASDERYSIAQAGRFGLRALHDIGVVDAADVLTACFVANGEPDEPDPMWVAEHIDTPARLQHVRRRGDLEATALAVCAAIAGEDPPAWLDEAVREARFDERTPMRETAWRAAGERSAWFDAESVRHALRDASAAVRIAALQSCPKQGPALPPTEVRRLSVDKNGSVRLALTRLLEAAPDDYAIAALLSDPDAYVRGIARKRLGRR